MIIAAQAQDLDQITEMWMDVSRKEFVQFLGQDVIEFFIEHNDLREEVECCSDTTYVYKQEEQVLGFVVLAEDLIELLVVRPECQNQNIGKQLYDYSISLVAQQFHQVRAECIEQDEKANKLLSARGFEYIGHYEDEMGFTRRQYQKQLIDML